MSDNLLDKQKAASKSAIWYTAATLLTKGLGFITIPIFTRIMTTGEFGLFNNFAAWLTILLSIFSLESYATLNRARLDYNGKHLQDYQFTLITSAMGITLLLLVLLVAVPAIPEAITDLDRKYLYVLVLYLLFYPAFTMFQMLQRVQYRYKLSACLALGSSLVATVLSVLLVIYLPDHLMGRIVGQYVPFILLGICFYFWYWRTGGHFDLGYLKYALPLCVPLVVTTLGSQVLLLGCRIVTQHACGADQVAYLSLATTLAQIALILINAINNAWAPFLYDCLEAGAPEKALRVFRVYIWGIAILVIYVSFFAPELVIILGGNQYLPTIWIAPSFLAIGLLCMLINQYVYLETYHKKIVIGSIATLIIGCLNLPLCWLFIRDFGFNSIGYASIISYFILILVHMIIVSKFDSPNIFSFRVSGTPLFVGLASIPLSLALFELDASWARYCILAFLTIIGIVVLFRNRTKILQIIKRG